MSDLITVQGVVLSAMPMGEYDRRIVLLTRERGKLSAFAKGARRPNSPFMAASDPFVFGTFTLYEGKNSYNLNQVEIREHFVELAARQPGIYYGYYFLELCDYFGREGLDGTDMMNLLYVSAKALLHEKIEDRLVRCAFELRLLTIQGMMPELFSCVVCGKKPESGEDAGELFFSPAEKGILCSSCRQSAPYAIRISYTTWLTMRFITAAPLGKLFTFTVTAEILKELESCIHPYMAAFLDKRIRSLEILDLMTG